MKSDIRQPNIAVPKLLDRTLTVETNKSLASLIAAAAVKLCDDLHDVEVNIHERRKRRWFSSKVCVDIQLHGNPISVAKACFRLEQLMVELYNDHVKVSHKP